MKGAFSLKHKRKSSKAVLLFHGLTGAPGELYHYGYRLFEEGYDVYCPVLPGHCRGTEAIKKTHLDDWLTFSLNEYDKISRGYRNLYLSGICLGAVLALYVASERKNVKGISCLSTTLFLDGWSLPWFSFLLPLVIYTVMKFYYAFPEGGAFGVKNAQAQKKVKAALENKSQYLDCFPIICVLEMLRLSRYMRRRFKRITAPVILIHSAKDDLTSVKSAEAVYRGIKSVKKEYVKLTNSYHLIAIDNEKDIVFDKTVNFFAGV
jgi:carboxylesterase